MATTHRFGDHVARVITFPPRRRRATPRRDSEFIRVARQLEALDTGLAGAYQGIISRHMDQILGRTAPEDR